MEPSSRGPGPRRCAVLLRGINVGRAHRLSMADLRAALERAGCTDVSTYLQSGNALATADPDGLAERVVAELPLPVPVVVLEADELRAAVAGCPWRERAQAEPAQVHLAYVDRLPEPERLAPLRAACERGGDALAVGPRVLYLGFAGRSVDAPLSKALTRADLGTTWTARNWTTATKLAELA